MLKYGYAEIGGWTMGEFFIPLLLKFGTQENIESLLNDGTIYMNRLGHYVELEKDELEKKIKRADRYDGLHMRFKPTGVTMIVDDHKIEGSAKSVDITINETLEKYVYCLAGITIERLYAYKAGKITRLIPEDLEKFGEYCTVIIDTGQFVKRINDHFDVEDQKYISYIDLENTEGFIGPFKKDWGFQDQLEFRLLVKNHDNSKSPIKKNIGGLSGAFNLETKLLEEKLTNTTVRFNEVEREEMNLLDVLIMRYEEDMEDMRRGN
ncbi:hypothetical protein ACFX4I_02325 [Peribacillus sp. YIM B13472]|uniref:hypothetical protein n=1 Tax=Peribacillus sp. YIM B13472 TaxID=3366297 RepID=UPI00366FADCA